MGRPRSVGHRARVRVAMYPHRIRLRGPWDYEPVARTVIRPDGSIEEDTANLPRSGRMNLPGSWETGGLGAFAGRVRFRRGFGRPRAGEGDERYWLVFDGVDYFATVWLDGRQLGRHEGYFERFEFDVTEPLRERNELVVEVDAPAEAEPTRKRLLRGIASRGHAGGGIWRDAAVEIRPAVRLRDTEVSVRSENRSAVLHVRTVISGQWAERLTLHIGVDDQSLMSQAVAATPEGTEFRWSGAMPAATRWQAWDAGAVACGIVRMDLVGRAETLDEHTWTVGVREVSLSDDLSHAELNGRRIELRWAAVETPFWLLDRARLAEQVARWKEQGVNAVRAEGQVLAPECYDELDRGGFLVVAGLPLVGGYTASEEFVQEAERQAKAAVGMLAHHPSIAAWRVHSVPSPHDAQLDERLLETVRRADPGRL